jgi:hypothetical protein
MCCPSHRTRFDRPNEYIKCNFLQVPNTESLLGANWVSFWGPKFAYNRISEVSVQTYVQGPIGDGISCHGYWIRGTGLQEILSLVGVTYKTGFGLDDWIYWHLDTMYIILYLSILLNWGSTYSLLTVPSIMQQSMTLIHTLLHNTVVVICIRCY